MIATEQFLDQFLKQNMFSWKDLIWPNAPYIHQKGCKIGSHSFPLSSECGGHLQNFVCRSLDLGHAHSLLFPVELVKRPLAFLHNLSEFIGLNLFSLYGEL